MKPSETGTVQETILVPEGNVSSTGTYASHLIQESVKSRYPMRYDKKKILRYKGYFPYLPVKGYSARSVIQRPNFIQRWDRVVKNGTGKIYEQSYSASQKYLFDPFGFSLFNEQLINQLHIEANVNYLNKINRRKLSILEEAKNFRSTLETIASSVLALKKRARQMIADPYDFVTRGRRHEQYPYTKETFYRMGKTYGDVWLEGRYHWLPTYMSMRDAFIALQDMFPVMETYHKQEIRISQTLTYPRNTYEGRARTLDVDYLYTIKLGGYITTQSEGPLLAKAYGVNGLPDLAAVAWELTPWSLVVDWVLPISDVLLAMNAMDGLSSFATWKVVKVKIMASTPSPLSKQAEYDYINPWGDREQRWFVERQPPSIEGELYTRSVMNPALLDIQPFVASQPLNVLRAIDALSFFSGTTFSKKVLSGKT